MARGRRQWNQPNTKKDRFGFIQTEDVVVTTGKNQKRASTDVAGSNYYESIPPASMRDRNKEFQELISFLEPYFKVLGAILFAVGAIISFVWYLSKLDSRVESHDEGIKVLKSEIREITELDDRQQSTLGEHSKRFDELKVVIDSAKRESVQHSTEANTQNLESPSEKNKL